MFLEDWAIDNTKLSKDKCEVHKYKMRNNGMGNIIADKNQGDFGRSHTEHESAMLSTCLKPTNAMQLL